MKTSFAVFSLLFLTFWGRADDTIPTLGAPFDYPASQQGAPHPAWEKFVNSYEIDWRSQNPEYRTNGKYGDDFRSLVFGNTGADVCDSQAGRSTSGFVNPSGGIAFRGVPSRYIFVHERQHQEWFNRGTTFASTAHEEVENLYKWQFADTPRARNMWQNMSTADRMSAIRYYRYWLLQIKDATGTMPKELGLSQRGSHLLKSRSPVCPCAGNPCGAMPGAMSPSSPGAMSSAALRNIRNIGMSMAPEMAGDIVYDRARQAGLNEGTSIALGTGTIAAGTYYLQAAGAGWTAGQATSALYCAAPAAAAAAPAAAATAAAASVAAVGTGLYQMSESPDAPGTGISRSQMTSINETGQMPDGYWGNFYYMYVGPVSSLFTD